MPAVGIDLTGVGRIRQHVMNRIQVPVFPAHWAHNTQTMEPSGEFEETAGVFGIPGKQVTNDRCFGFFDADTRRVTRMIRVHTITMQWTLPGQQQASLPLSLPAAAHA